MLFRLTRFSRIHQRLGLSALAVLVGTSAVRVQGEEYLNGITWTPPAIVTPGEGNTAPPSDAIVLFGGTDLSSWTNAERWTVQDGAMVAGSGVVQTKEEFGDCQLHIEWSAPTPPQGTSQDRGNSGVFFFGRYEIQVLDSYENETYYDGQAGAIYKQTPPMANAMRPPGEWNTYDIFWTAPRFNEDKSLKTPAYITAVHNGVLVLNHFELKGDTPYNRPPRYESHGETGPISLQDHGNPVRFRNIWVRSISPVEGKQDRWAYIRDGEKETPIE